MELDWKHPVVKRYFWITVAVALVVCAVIVGLAVLDQEIVAAAAAFGFVLGANTIGILMWRMLTALGTAQAEQRAGVPEEER